MERKLLNILQVCDFHTDFFLSLVSALIMMEAMTFLTNLVAVEFS